MSECSLLTPLRRDGTSQRQRMPTALDPDAAPVDQRSTADLLLYASELARLLRYYSEENVPSGDWSPFLEHDVSTLVARVGAHDTEPLQAEFDRLRAAALAATTPVPFGRAFVMLAAPVITLASAFERWRHASIEGLQLRVRLDRLITGVLADALRDAISAVKRAHDLGAPTPPAVSGFGGVWGDLNPPSNAALFASGGFTDADERRIAVLAVAQGFERLYEAARRLKEDAPRFLVETLARYPQHQPHVALFLAFLRLMNQTRYAMNGLTASHLDFYYRDVLRLVPRGPVADRVHVIFELAKNLPPSVLPKDTRLNAKKDTTGVPRIYATDDELVVNRAALHRTDGLKMVFLDIGPGDIVRNIHAATLPPPTGADQRWRPFGSTGLPYARTGFAAASPMLWLTEGTRTVTLRFVLTPASDVLRDEVSPLLVARELTHNVIVEATGPKGWIPANVQASVEGTGGNRYIEYEITIPRSAPAVVGLDPKIHVETFDTTLPVFRFLLKSDGLPGGELPDTGPTPFITDFSDEAPGYAPNELVRFEGHVYKAGPDVTAPALRPSPSSSLWTAIPYANPYKYFERIRIAQLDLTVNVNDMRGIVLENDFGALNPTKPFLPFGPMPRAGSSLLIGSSEIFQKQLTELHADITWAGLPETTSFADYYDKYRTAANTTIVTANSYFRVDLEVLSAGAWMSKGEEALFDTKESGAPDESLNFSVSFNDTAVEFPRDPSLPPFRRFDRDLPRGFLRLTLKTSFLHEMFPVALARFAKDATENTPPNPPYTPTISELTVGYTARQIIEYDEASRSEVEGRIERLFQIGPFGHQEFAPVAPAAAVPGVEPAGSPVPPFTVNNDDASSGPAEGTLYLGIANLEPPQNLSLLFQMAEGSEDPALPATDVQWGYLTTSGWKDFARAEILLDRTNELIGSGIVRFEIPTTATSQATVLPANVRWLRATVRRGSPAIPNAVAVLAQAAQASFRDRGNDPRHLDVPLPAGTIAKLVERHAAIKSVAQPFSSFGGRPAEQDDAFRVRVAERLRHKRRAVTIFDYERLVLERFPEVYKVRCLSHTDGLSEYAPGAVRVVVVPNLRNRNAVDPLRPRLSLSKLEEIRNDLVSMATDFANIQVVNPEYEEVRVRFNVRFRRGFDKGHYTGQLERDIIRFLSPWLHDDGIDLTFGGRVHRSAILNFIDEREYVDFVADFEMDHIVPGPTPAETSTRSNVEEAEPTRSSAVIVPAPAHAVGDAIVSCADEPGDEGPAGAAAPPFVPRGPRYLGNVRTRELHDLQNLTPYCRIDEIAIDRKYPFRRIEDAQTLGYDFCAYCFGDRSRR